MENNLKNVYPSFCVSTKKEKLLSARLPVAVDYYLVHFRAYVGDSFYRLRFVLPFDLDLDIPDGMTYTTALRETVDSILLQDMSISEWIDFCNKTIKRFNS